MKNRFYLLAMVLAFCSIIGGSCKKESVQPTNAKNQSGGNTGNVTVASSAGSGASSPAGDAPSSSECNHGH